MTTQAFTFSKSDAIEALLKQSNHFLMTTSYKGLVDVGISQKMALPIISIEADGSTILSINHEPYLPADFTQSAHKDACLRLTVSTIVPDNTTFDPINQTDVDFLKSFPSVHGIKVKLPSVTDLAHADSDAEVMEILQKDIKPSSHDKTVPSSIVITPSILDRIIQDRCINPTQTLTSVLAWMRENKITRGSQGGKLNTSQIKPYAKEIISFLTLAFKIFETPGDEDGEEPFVAADILKKCAPVLIDNPYESELYSMGVFKGTSLKDLEVPLDKLNGLDETADEPADLDCESDDRNDPVIINPVTTTTKVRVGKESFIIPSASVPSASGHIASKAISSADNLSRCLPASSLSSKPSASSSSHMPSLSDPLAGTKVPRKNKPTTAASALPPPQSVANQVVTCQKDAAMIQLLQQMNTELKSLKAAPVSSSSSSTMTFSKWNARVQDAILVLTSPDPSVPATSPSPELLDLCLEATGVAMAQKIATTYIDLDINPDIALCRNIKRGNFSMNEGFRKGCKITGLSPLSCPPKYAIGSGKDHNFAMARAEFLTATNSLSEQDIRDLSFQSFYIPNKTLQFYTVMTNYIHLLKIVFSKKSFIYVTVAEAFDSIKSMTSQMESYEDKDGSRFFFNLVGAIHTAIAIFINKILKNPKKANKSLERSLERIQDALRDSTFMNTFALPMIKGDNDDSTSGAATGGDSSSGDRNSSGGGNSRNSGRNTTNDDQSSNNNGRDKRRKVNNAYLNDTCSNVFDMSALSKNLPAAKARGVAIPKFRDCECCLKWFFKGVCDASCPRKVTHVQLRGENLQKWKKFRLALENQCRDSTIAGG